MIILNSEKYTFSNENSSELQIFSKTSEFVSLKSSLKENNNVSKLLLNNFIIIIYIKQKTFYYFNINFVP